MAADAGWHRWLEQIEALRSLKDGWNGYSAPAPNDKSIANALLFLQVMHAEGTEPTRVAPSAMGGVAVIRRVGKRKVFVEFYNDGRVYALFSEKATAMNVVPVSANSLSFRALITNGIVPYEHLEMLCPKCNEVMLPAVVLASLA